jgi:hypothetical protein
MRPALPRVARALAGVLLAVGLFNGAGARAQDVCRICKEKIQDTMIILEDKYHKTNWMVCKTCIQLQTHCVVCNIRVHPNFGLHLPDGRAFCPDDAATAVMTEEAAETLFAKARQETTDLLRQYPPLAQRNVTTHLVTREEFNRQYRRTPGIEDPSTLLGLTITRHKDKDELEHDIYLLHGLPQNEFLAVSAHEFTHTWLNERAKNTRQLHKDTTEGICELVAHKLAGQLGFDREQQRILESTYTRGQVAALLAAEKEYGFYRLVQWITDGVDSWLDADKLARLLVLREPEDKPAPTLNWLPVVASPMPDHLVLKGLTLIGTHRHAWINDTTLEAGAETRVRVGTSNLVVRCISISTNAVTIHVKGEAAPRQLQLGAK